MTSTSFPGSAWECLSRGSASRNLSRSVEPAVVMSDEELKQLIESNARTAQAMLDTMTEARFERPNELTQLVFG